MDKRPILKGGYDEAVYTKEVKNVMALEVPVKSGHIIVYKGEKAKQYCGGSVILTAGLWADFLEVRIPLSSLTESTNERLLNYGCLRRGGHTRQTSE